MSEPKIIMNTYSRETIESIKPKTKEAMTIKQLKETISSLPDDALVLVDVSHTVNEWDGCTTTIVGAEYDDMYEFLCIIATIDDEL